MIRITAYVLCDRCRKKFYTHADSVEKTKELFGQDGCTFQGQECYCPDCSGQIDNKPNAQ